MGEGLVNPQSLGGGLAKVARRPISYFITLVMRYDRADLLSLGAAVAVRKVSFPCKDTRDYDHLGSRPMKIDAVRDARRTPPIRL